jgi:hypothetical protein
MGKKKKKFTPTATTGNGDERVGYDLDNRGKVVSASEG